MRTSTNEPDNTSAINQADRFFSMKQELFIPAVISRTEHSMRLTYLSEVQCYASHWNGQLCSPCGTVVLSSGFSATVPTGPRNKGTAITVRQGRYEIGRGKLGVREALPGSRGEYDARVQHLLNIALEAASMNTFSALLPSERN